MTIEIKAFSFNDFVDSQWKTWSHKKLCEAHFKSQKRLCEAGAGQEVKPGDENEEEGIPSWTSDQQNAKGNAYYQGRNVSKAPLTFDETDYKFLSQFPPQFWSQALRWRYNDGLLQAAASRDNEKIPYQDRRDAKYVDDTIEYLTFNNGKAGKARFYNVWTGFSDLIKKLEKPIKNNQTHNPGGYYPDGGAGIEDIDPDQTDPNHPQHPSNYKGGLYDFDLSDIVKMTPEYVDKLPPEKIPVPAHQERNEKTIAAARERMKKNLKSTAAGMSLMTEKVSREKIMMWLRSQAAGLLGQPTDIKDPHTNEPLSVHEKNIADINQHWGESDETSGSKTKTTAYLGMGKNAQPANVPVIQRKLSWTKISPDGTEYDVINEPVTMPYLKPTTMIPNIKLSPEQKEEIAKRNGFDMEKECGSTNGISFSDLLTFNDRNNASLFNCAEKARKLSVPGSMERLLSHFWDIYTDDQKKEMREKSLNLIKWHAHRNKNSAYENPHASDEHAEGQGHYLSGWHVMKGSRKIPSMHMSKEDAQKVFKKYYNQMTAEAAIAMNEWLSHQGAEEAYQNLNMKDAKSKTDDRYKKLPPHYKIVPMPVAAMISNISGSLISTAGAMLCMWLNTTDLGIYDPEVKLTEFGQDGDPQAAKKARKFYVLNFIKDMSKVAMDGIGSYRQRIKQGYKDPSFGTSTDAPSGEDGKGSIGDTIQKGSIDGGSQQKDHDPRRSHLTPDVAAKTVINAKGKEEDAYPIARQSWILAKTGLPEIDELFMTNRAQVQYVIGGGYENIIDIAAAKAQAEIKAMAALTVKNFESLKNRQDISDKEKDKMAHDMASDQLPAYLQQNHPDLYKNIDDKTKESLISRYKKEGPGITNAANTNAHGMWETFFRNLAAGIPVNRPIEDQMSGEIMWSDEQYTIKDLAPKESDLAPQNIASLVGLIRNQWTEDGAKSVIVPLVQKMYKAHNKNLTTPEAVELVKKSVPGFVPIQSISTDPAQPAQPAQVQQAQQQAQPVAPPKTPQNINDLRNILSFDDNSYQQIIKSIMEPKNKKYWLSQLAQLNMAHDMLLKAMTQQHQSGQPMSKFQFKTYNVIGDFISNAQTQTWQ